MAKRKAKSGGVRTKEEYQGLNTKEAQAAEIMTAPSALELDAMWEAWEERGQDPIGLTRKAILERKVELGIELTKQEAEALKKAEARLAVGSKRRPIRGRFNI